MTLPVSATIAFKANAKGQLTPANLAAAIDVSLIPLDPSFLLSSCSRLISDTTANDATSGTRTIVLDLTLAPMIAAPGNGTQANNFQLQLYSTSDQDKVGGVGMHAVTVTYHDKAGGAHTETITLTGKTPVLSANTNYFTINDIQRQNAAAVGSLGGNAGQIIARAVLPGVVIGGPDGALPQPVPFPVVATVIPSYQATFGNASPTPTPQMLQPFQLWLNNVLGAQVGPIVAAAVSIGYA